MKIIIFGDVHGDIYSLETLFKTTDADAYMCIGDLVGYGPHGEQCLNLAIDKCGIDNVIQGNHEKFYIDGKVDRKCSDLARSSFNISYQRFAVTTRENWRTDSLDILKQLQQSIELEFNSKKVVLSHTFGNRYIYPDTKIDFDIKGDINIFGHTHVQFIKFSIFLI